jgi:hypothetical protein
MGAINVSMNEAFALDLFDLVRSQKGVLPHLYALTEKIENQFYFMGRLTTRKETDETSDAVITEAA